MSAWYGLLAWALLIGALASRFSARPALRYGLAIVAMVAALAPLVAGESLAMWLHGALDRPSFTLVQLAGLYITRQPPRPAKSALVIFIVLTTVFYVLALGLGPLDPFGSGFRHPLVLLALLPLACWLWFRHLEGWLLILGMDLFAYAAGIFDNLWSALFDPLLLIAAIVAFVTFARPAQGSPPQRPDF